MADRLVLAGLQSFLELIDSVDETFWRVDEVVALWRQIALVADKAILDPNVLDLAMTAFEAEDGVLVVRLQSLRARQRGTEIERQIVTRGLMT